MPKEIVGHIGVDSGLCWIGDPCYALPDDRREDVGRNWFAFCEQMRGLDSKAFDHKLWVEGLGVCVQTGWGDGFYPVHVTRSAAGHIASVTVTFISNEDAA